MHFPFYNLKLWYSNLLDILASIIIIGKCLHSICREPHLVVGRQAPRSSLFTPSLSPAKCCPTTFVPRIAKHT